jgi:hypothetical protein
VPAVPPGVGSAIVRCMPAVVAAAASAAGVCASQGMVPHQLDLARGRLGVGLIDGVVHRIEPGITDIDRAARR